jgi:hypothetical protein
MMCWILLGVASNSAAQRGTTRPEESTQDTEKEQFERWIKHYQGIADGYSITLESAPSELLRVTPKPIHLYRNPSSGRDSHGAFFVWTHAGRAEVIGAIWSRLTSEQGDQRYLIHEFQSLATEPLQARGQEGVRWNPRSAGVTLQQIPGAPRPSESKQLRLAQMRALAREFTGYHVHPVERQLRLLPQPLYRFEGRDADADGAVFGLFQEWDPEIILMIESRPTDSGPKWHFAAGRLSDRPLRLQHKDADVWKHEGGDFGDPSGAFYAIHGVSVRPTVLP